MIKRKDPQKNRPCAIFVGERVKKKGSCGGFPNLRNIRNRCCSTIGRAGKGYPLVPYCTWSKVARLCNSRK